MAKYRKKPIVVEAVLWKPGIEDGYVFEDINTGVIVGCSDKPQPCEKWRELSKQYPLVGIPAIKTLEGWMKVSPGDWIITGVNGERYPIKPDIFEKTYELVED